MYIDFKISEKNIEYTKPVTESELLKFKEFCNIDLPPSYVDFKKNIADSLYISTGNAFELFPLNEKKNTFTIVGITNDYAHLGNVLKSHKLLIFGMSGVDSESWAFYTGKKYPDREYPILWISPEEERFFIHSTNFESFINIQFHSLTKTESIEDYDSYYKDLISKYDTKIEPFGYDSVYQEAHDLTDLEMIMTRLY